MASRTARACVHFETELVDELLGADERRVGGGVECVTTVIELLAPDQLLGARRGVGVDRIERASVVVARGGVRRVLLHANRIETGAARERRALPLVPPPSIEQPATTIAATCRARCASRTPDRAHERSPRAVIVAQHVGRRQLTTKRTRRKLNKLPDRIERFVVVGSTSTQASRNSRSTTPRSPVTYIFRIKSNNYNNNNNNKTEKNRC